MFWSSDLFDRQRARFEAALSDIEAFGARPRYRHAANSAALLRDPRAWYDRVRPGLLLYGIVPPPLTSAIELTPVMTLGSRVVAVKGLRPGEVSGYGARFTAVRATTIAIVPAGYADGLDLRLGGRGAVLIRGPRDFAVDDAEGQAGGVGVSTATAACSCGAAGRRSSARSAWTCSPPT